MTDTKEILCSAKRGRGAKSPAQGPTPRVPEPRHQPQRPHPAQGQVPGPCPFPLPIAPWPGATSQHSEGAFSRAAKMPGGCLGTGQEGCPVPLLVSPRVLGGLSTGDVIAPLGGTAMALGAPWPLTVGYPCPPARVGCAGLHRVPPAPHWRPGATHGALRPGESKHFSKVR